MTTENESEKEKLWCLKGICLFVLLPGIPSVLDPSGHLFRIRLICTLLDTCGQYFDHGNYKKKLDCFLVYFQVKSQFMNTLKIVVIIALFFPDSKLK